MANATILVVEDERLVARGIQDNLENLGYAVAGPAFSGEEAIARVREKKPDLILMDIFLAGNMDGIAVAQQIKEMTDTPIVYLTAYADPRTLERAKVTEPYGYILKPYEERELHSTIEMALYKSRSEKRLHHLNELLESIRKIHTTIFREKDRQRLLHQVSRLLTEMRGYARAWIAQVDKDGLVVAGAAAGQEEEAAKLEVMLQQGVLPECGRRSLERSGAPVIRNTSLSCADCGFHQKGEGLSPLLVELAHHERRYGIMGVCLEADLAADARETSLLQEMANDIALALANLELAEQARQYQTALAASEAKYRLFFDNAPLGLMHYDQNGTVLAVNDAFVTIMGSSREKMMSFQMLNQLRDDRMLQAVKESLAGGTGYYEGEYLSVTGGKKVPIRAFFRSIFADSGEFLGGVSIFEDYTEKFKAEQGKEESLTFLQNLMDAIPNPVFYKDAAGRYLGINKATEQAWGRTREEIIGKTVFELHPPDLAAIYQARDQELFQQPGIQIYETQIAGSDGSRRNVVLHKATFFQPDGTVGGLIGVELDITERKRMEEALRESERRLSLAQRIAHIGNWEWEVDSGKTFWSDEVYRIFGLEPGTRKPSYELAREHTHLDDLKLWRQTVREALDAQDWFNLDYRGLRADGSLVWIHNEAQIVRNGEGRAVKIVGTAQDITERKQAEEEKDRLEAQLFQTQKMEALGTLAGGIAHDFNNILWAILGYTEMTLMSLPENCQERFNLEQVMQAGQRARDLVNQILAFSRKSVKEKKPFRLSLIVKEALKLMRATLPTTIIFRHQIEAQEALVQADVTQLHQVVMNLCTNAAQAMMESGGTLFVGLEELVVAADNQTLFPDLTPGPYAALTVSDTGPGIEPALLPRIFEPFFTTKGVGKGSGLGLSVVHGIVKSHGGEITVSSQLGRGSIFTVFLPIVGGEEQIVPEAYIPIPTGTSRILCVDDEPMLVALFKAELGKLGYEVTAKTSSVEALEIFRAHPEHFDLVITDQTMPHLTGMQLARELKGLRADIPIIICTGYSDKVSEATIHEAGINKMLMKPIDLRHLAEAIRRVLDEGD